MAEEHCVGTKLNIKALDMPRPKSKEELLKASTENFDKLLEMVHAMSDQERNARIDFSDESTKKEAHWQRDKNLRDIFIHLYEWHQLLLHWVQSNMNGKKAPFLPLPYNWKTYGELNVVFWERHQETTYEDSIRMLKKSHHDVMELMKTLSNDELFIKKYFDWTGTTSLGSYYVSATSSHYEWGIKKIRAHVKKVRSR